MNHAPFRRTLSRTLTVCLAAPLILTATPGLAQAEDEDAEVVVTSEMEWPVDAVWKHSFDAYEGEAGALNGPMQTALRFARGMEAEGSAPERVKLAIVVHGPAVFDVVSDARYKAKYDTQFAEYNGNPSRELVKKLIARGAEIWVCGVAAKYHKVGNADLIEGVKMAPSGTIAHAELQRRGFGLNPY
ncbi:MAG: DsrE family protein [Pseudomonadota bacterium]